jgi:cytochrome P450
MNQAVLTGEPSLHWTMPDFAGEPYPHYHQLRSFEPVYRLPIGFWMLTRYKDVASVLKDPRFTRDYSYNMHNTYGPDAFNEPVLDTMRRMMLLLDPPDHPRIRSLVSKVFSARRMEGMRSIIQTIVNDLLDDMEAMPDFDLMATFATELPIRVISHLMGLTSLEYSRITQAIRLSTRMLDLMPMNRTELDEGSRLMLNFKEAFRDALDMRRASPRDDLITALLQVEEAGDQLSYDELVANVILLFVAGYETTSNLIGNAVVAILSTPDELARVRSDSTILQDAVDELLRYDSPVQFVGRSVGEDLLFDGKPLRKGEFVVACVGAANRDPEVFDRPDELRLLREGVKPLSFGGGIHFCLGAQLARIETGLALSALFRRFPRLRLAGSEPYRRKPGFVIRGLDFVRLEHR